MECQRGRFDSCLLRDAATIWIFWEKNTLDKIPLEFKWENRRYSVPISFPLATYKLTWPYLNLRTWLGPVE